MRKKELLNQNISLFDELQKCRVALKNSTDELERCKNNISKLELENKILKSRIDHLSNNEKEETGFTVDTSVDTQPEYVPEENESEFPEWVNSDEWKYGSKIIGNIVLETANSINNLTSCDEETKHTLSNLILCRSELAKSDILSICRSESPIDTKCEMIDSVYNETTDYYKSVLGQIN